MSKARREIVATRIFNHIVVLILNGNGCWAPTYILTFILCTAVIHNFILIVCLIRHHHRIVTVTMLFFAYKVELRGLFGRTLYPTSYARLGFVWTPRRVAVNFFVLGRLGILAELGSTQHGTAEGASISARGAAEGASISAHGRRTQLVTGGYMLIAISVAFGRRYC